MAKEERSRKKKKQDRGKRAPFCHRHLSPAWLHHGRETKDAYVRTYVGYLSRHVRISSMHAGTPSSSRHTAVCDSLAG